MQNQHTMKKIFIHFVALWALCSANVLLAAINPRVLMQTNLGELVIELFPRESPVTVKNFLDYVDSDFYNGTIFQRVVPGFFIQGGEFTSDFTTKPTRAPIKNESGNGLKNEYLTVAMAHSEGAISGTNLVRSQFFINMQNNTALNANGKSLGYPVFGRVIEGIEIAEKISLQPRGMHEKFPEAPNLSVHILKIERLYASKPAVDIKVENEMQTETSATETSAEETPASVQP